MTSPRFSSLPPSAPAWAALFALLLLGPSVAHAQGSLFADPKARQSGDVITIVLAERTAAQRESGWQNKSDAQMNTDAGVTGKDLSGRFGLDAQFNKEALNRNESTQSDLLRGTITAMVVGVDSTGNLIVQGERKLNVNGETHLMRVHGVARPYDVRYDNSILSYQIANASIEYRRDGFGRKRFKPALLARTGLTAVIAAAVFMAMK